MDLSPWKVGDVIAASAFGFSVLAAIAGLFYYLVNDPTDRKRIGAWLQRATIWEGYRSGVIWGLDRLQEFYGRPFSWGAFRRCYSVALCYGLLLFLVAWACGGPAIVTKGFWLPDGWSWWLRWLLLFAFVASASSGFWIASNGTPEAITKRFGLPNWAMNILDLIVLCGLAAAGVATVAIANALDVTDFPPWTGFIATIPAVVGLIIRIDLGEAIVSFAAVFLVVLPLIALVWSPRVSFVITVSFFCLILLLPAINGIADLVSLGVSRRLLDRARSEAALAGHVCLDIALAFLFLFLLGAFLLTAVFSVAHAAALFFDIELYWRPYFVSARSEPWSGGLMVTLMLCSTLAPTFAHLFVAAMALVVRPLPGNQRVAVWLRSEIEPLASQKIGAVAYLMLALLVGLAGFSGVLIGIWWLIDIMTDSTVGGYLYQFAGWSVRLFFDAPEL